jgi:ubiquinone/menaquinone biosynthesis C-methylase UbiE
MATNRTQRMERLARVYDAEVLPIWTERFAKLMLRDLELPERCQILDVGCGTGAAAMELLQRMDTSSRLIAIESAPPLLDVARDKLSRAGMRNVFFRSHAELSELSFADDVYDAVVSNLGLTRLAHRQRALGQFARVAKPGGEVRCSLPLEGTFQEFFDIYREVLTKHDKHDTLARLAKHVQSTYPTPEQVEAWGAAAGLFEPRVEIEEFSMLFRSSREFFFAPVIEYGPLPEWKAVAGRGQEMQDVFWYIKEAIDAYFEGRAFQVTVVAGCLVGRKPQEFDEQPTRPIEDLDDAETEEHDTHDKVDAAARVTRSESVADVELDAFIDGKPRPDHLDED